VQISAISAVTITWARSAAERDLLARSLRSLAQHGLRITIADRTEPPIHLDDLRGLTNCTLVRATGATLVNQVQTGFATDSRNGSSFVLYSEPDKEQFFQHHLRSFVAAAPDDDNVGIVLASRSPGSFFSFPAMQRRTERAVNALCSRMLSARGDYCYGPFLMHRALVPDVASLPEDLGWGWRPAMFLRARERGYRVVPIVGDFDCPVDQRLETDADRSHRLRQFSQNLRAFES
jgi:hypothetical protein